MANVRENRLAYAARMAGFQRAPKAGDGFSAKMTRSGISKCVEYTLPPPDGMRVGATPPFHFFEAHEVRLVMIPADPRRRLPAEPGIAVRTECSRSCEGSCEEYSYPKETWINVSRGRHAFAFLVD